MNYLYEDDPPAFERIRIRRATPPRIDRAKPRGKRPWREHNRRSVFTPAV